MLDMHVHTGHLAAPVKAHESKSNAPCCIAAPGLSCTLAATVAKAAAFASARGCRVGEDARFGLSFERLCSLGDNKEKFKRKQACS
jgi:hypothetical protein